MLLKIILSWRKTSAYEEQQAPCGAASSSLQSILLKNDLTRMQPDSSHVRGPVQTYRHHLPHTKETETFFNRIMVLLAGSSATFVASDYPGKPI